MSSFLPWWISFLLDVVDHMRDFSNWTVIADGTYKLSPQSTSAIYDYPSCLSLRSIELNKIVLGGISVKNAKDLVPILGALQSSTDFG